MAGEAEGTPDDITVPATTSGTPEALTHSTLETHFCVFCKRVDPDQTAPVGAV